MSESGGKHSTSSTAHTKIREDADDVRWMMLILISEAISNSNAVIRREFRKLRFQMIDDTVCVLSVHVGPPSEPSSPFSVDLFI